MSGSQIDLDFIDRLTSGRIGTLDMPCPICGPTKRTAAKQRKPVLRIWRLDPGFATFHCARCGEKGHARDGRIVIRRDPAAIARAQAEAAERDRVITAERLSKARWLRSCSRHAAGTIAETYLREARGYRGRNGQPDPPIPTTLGFLPARDEYPPAMIALFGIPGEPEPGRLARLADDALRGVHLTRLKPDGSDKAGIGDDKVMIGRSTGAPIVLGPVNDLLGLAIAEGIENALSAQVATGLGAWAAGAASRLPAIAAAVPSYVEAVTIIADDDPGGRRYANELAARLKNRDLDLRFILPGGGFRRAA
jgi:hypothetical protein